MLESQPIIANNSKVKWRLEGEEIGNTVDIKEEVDVAELIQEDGQHFCNSWT